MKSLAHVADRGREHDLAAHLQGVAQRARRFAEDFGGADHAEVAGLWHDLGKYAADFQRMLRAAQGVEAHVETELDIASKKKVDHSSAGALHAASRGGPDGLPIAFAIAGHHAGLADGIRILHERLQGRGKGRLDAALAANPPAEILDRTVPPLAGLFRPASSNDGAAHRRLEVFTRMIFSALCDADFLDTEEFFDSGRPALRGGHVPIDALAARLQGHVDALTNDDSEVNRVRAEVRRACLAAVERPPGVFTLSVPTLTG